MDKILMLSVAGSGKTHFIIERLNLNERSLIVTYTDSNCENIRKRIISKFGCFPDNIHLSTYFTFLYSFCFKPYLSYKHSVVGINYDIAALPRRFNINDNRRYIDNNRRLYGARIAKFIDIKEVKPLIIRRLSKYFDSFFIDEVQDFGGQDFNFVISLLSAELSIYYVGDFYQHTYDTSRDGSVNASLYNDYNSYVSKFRRAGMMINITTLSKSHRCSPSVCLFINDSLRINIESHRNDNTPVRFIDDDTEIMSIYNNRSIVKLFYQKHKLYACNSQNWGNCKGEDHYTDVCVVLNKKSLSLYEKNELYKSATRTKNKLYVACSRARQGLYFISEAQLKSLINT